MLEKLRRIHEGSDFTDHDIKIKELASQLIDWFREQFVKERVQSSENVQTKSVEKVEDDPRFKLSVETRVKLASKRTFKEDLEITRSSLTRLGYNLKKETKPNVTTEPLKKNV